MHDVRIQLVDMFRWACLGGVRRCGCHTGLSVFQQSKKDWRFPVADGYAGLQFQHAHKWQPVAFASRSMTETLQRYSQIEKEALALVWACEKFADYIIGEDIDLETDHKPFVPLLGKNNVDCLLPRVLCFWICLMHFSYASVMLQANICIVQMHSPEHQWLPLTAHMLQKTAAPNGLLLRLSFYSHPMQTVCTSTIQHSTMTRPASAKLTALCKSRWPHKDPLSGTILPY